MHDVYDVIKNIEKIYNSNTGFKILKDFERVIDELGLYVYANWEDGELAEGPIIDRHWVTCKFFWPRNKMPDPMGGKRLLDYDCKITYEKTHLVKPRKIRKPDDVRPGTKKGKLDRYPIWIVSIMMPKKLIADIFGGYKGKWDWVTDPANETNAPGTDQPADSLAATEPAGTDVGGDVLPPDAGGEATSTNLPTGAPQ